MGFYLDSLFSGEMSYNTFSSVYFCRLVKPVTAVTVNIPTGRKARLAESRGMWSVRFLMAVKVGNEVTAATALVTREASPA